MPVAPSTHSLFWLCGALFVVGAFLAVGGILRRALSVTDRSSRLIAVTGMALALGGLAGALVVASSAPGSTLAVMKEMVGLGNSAPPAPAPPPKPGVQQVQVAGVDFKFQPSTITIKAAKKVDFVFRNASSSSPHTFTIEGRPSFELKAEPGGSDSGLLKGLKPGTYQFICSIPGHVQLGMKGTLV